MNKLQRSVFPKIDLCTEQDLYFRMNEFASLDLKSSVIHFEKNGRIFTNTYFNSFTIGKWKNYTVIEDLNLKLKFKGKIKIIFKLNHLYFNSKILNEIYFESKETKEIIVPLSFFKELKDGMLFFEIRGLEISEVYSFEYFTNTKVKNNINLGIVITHFNRQQYVLPAIERLKKELIEVPEFKRKISLNIVDNSQNLPEVEGVNIVKNANLGGAGGFTRGLIYLQDQKEYTHCLFMDDDVSCEVEGIKRTINLLEFAKKNNVSIAGAMLNEAKSYIQYENGAKFPGFWQPINNNFDLRDRRCLLKNEEEVSIPAYGGWWFFAFPISEVKHYAFPYFVRGDDIGFGLVHKFNIITLNGISSWQGDFEIKNGVLSAYLDTRNHIMQRFHNLVPCNLKSIIKVSFSFLARNLLTYNYETALATVCAVEDVCKGPNFWRENVNMIKRRPEIAALAKDEKVVDIPLSKIDRSITFEENENCEEVEVHEKKIKTFFRWITLNGHLIPTIFFKSGMVQQKKGFGGTLRKVFRYKEVLYLHKLSGKGFILKHSKVKFFKILFRYFSAILKLSLKYRKLHKEYLATYDEFTSREFWEKQFYEKKKEKSL